jgi:hypothetical protein
MEIEKALLQLPEGDRWEIACWLLETLRNNSVSQPDSSNASAGPEMVQLLPDYAERRRRIFGEKVLPNMILESRSQERW